MFSERGYDGATFQAIAARADLTRPAINHYFSSKRVLYREVLDETNEFVIGAGIRQAERETTAGGAADGVHLRGDESQFEESLPGPLF